MKHLFAILLLILFCLYAGNRLLVNDFYTSHDGEGHVIRMEEFDLSFHDGQIPVRIAKRINFGLGYPFFNFNYPLVYYLAEMIHLLGLSFVWSFKVVMLLTLITGAISMYLFALLYFDGFSSFIAATFYIFAPYRFLNLYVRGDIAEAFGLSLIPLLFYSIESFLRNRKGRHILLITTVSILTLSHNITFLIGLTLGVIYFVLRLLTGKHNLSEIKEFNLSIISSALLTMFFWLPAVAEARLTKLSELTNDYKDFFPSIKELLYSSWGFGGFKEGNFPGKMSPQIGLIHELIFFSTIIIFAWEIGRMFKRTKNISFKKSTHSNKANGQYLFVLIFFVTVAIICFYLAEPFSKFLWDNIYPLKLVQIPWRFVGYIVFCLSFLAGFVLCKIQKKKWQIFSGLAYILLLFYANRNHIRVNQFIQFQDPFVKNQIYSLSTTSKDEHMPLDAPRIYTTPNQKGEILPETAGNSVRTVWKSNYHAFSVNLYKDADFRDNTSYFPGWVAKVDGKETSINYKIDNYKRLRIPLVKGNHRAEFFFRETALRLFADSVSLFSLILISLYFWYSYRVKKHEYSS